MEGNFHANLVTLDQQPTKWHGQQKTETVTSSLLKFCSESFQILSENY